MSKLNIVMSKLQCRKPNSEAHEQSEITENPGFSFLWGIHSHRQTMNFVSGCFILCFGW